MSVFFDISELTEIKKDLPRGYLRTIADQAKCSKQTVFNVFKDKCKDPDIIERVVTIALKLRAKKFKKAETIKKKISDAVS